VLVCAIAAALGGWVAAAPPAAAAAPDAPVVTATAIVQGVHLSWTAPADNGSPITGYNISRSTTTGTETFLVSVGAAVTTYDDTAVVTDGTEYFYTVTAVNSDGESVASTEVSATPLTGIPDAPVLTASPTLNGVHLSWTAPDTHGGTITHYRVHRSITTGGETLLVELGDVTTFDDTPLANDGTEYFYTVTAVTAQGESPPSNESSAIPTPDPTGEFVSLTPARVLDTRGDADVNAACPDNANLHTLGDDTKFDVTIAGCGGVPLTGVSAVVVNVTITNNTQDGFLTVWPAGTTQPVISNLNFTPMQTVPNLVTVGLGAGGEVSIYNKRGTVDVIVDVVGYYKSADAEFDADPGSRFHGVTPSRYFDTRDGHGGVPVGPLAPDTTMSFAVTGTNSVPSDATAVVMNVTAVNASTSSFLTVYPDDVERPTASNLNFTAPDPIPNLVVVRVPTDGMVDFYNRRGFVDVVADVVGFYDTDRTTDAGRFIPVTPFRRVDTRISSPFPSPGKVTGGSTLLARLPGTAGLPATGMGAVVANLTATEPTTAGFLTAYPPDGPLPFASNVNFVAGQTVPNLVMIEVSAGPPPVNGAVGAGWLGIYNPYGATHVIVDVFGYFTASTPGVNGAAAGGAAPLLAMHG
jgi:hypothetical protein